MSTLSNHKIRVGNILLLMIQENTQYKSPLSLALQLLLGQCFSSFGNISWATGET